MPIGLDDIAITGAFLFIAGAVLALTVARWFQPPPRVTVINWADGKSMILCPRAVFDFVEYPFGMPDFRGGVNVIKDAD